LAAWHDSANKDEGNLLRLLELKPAPSALIVGEDGRGPYVMEMLRHAEVRVPNELSVVAFAAVDARSPGADLTRVELSYAEIGAAGAAMLHDLADGPAAAPARSLRLTPRVVAGRTCAPWGERAGDCIRKGTRLTTADDEKNRPVTPGNGCAIGARTGGAE
jgi:DNA-binding LacI/PurR family transcriptional regulator